MYKNAALALYYDELKNDPLRPKVFALQINIGEQQQEQNESVMAFEGALMAGILSEDKSANNYVGAYMYMGMNNGKAAFKHIMTREYLKY
jgi:hypothetical protein